MNALDRLRKKHAEKTGKTLDGNAIASAPVAPTTVKSTTVVTDALLNRTRTLVDADKKVQEVIEAKAEEGLYTMPTIGESLEGLDSHEFMTNLRMLDTMLEEKSPKIGEYTLLIRKNLEQYAELTHILSDEQLGIICSGVLSVANASVAPTTKQGKAAGVKRDVKQLAKTVDAGDF